MRCNFVFFFNVQIKSQEERFLDLRAQNVGRTNVDFTVGLNALVLAHLLHDAYLQRRCWRTKRRDVLFSPTKGYEICVFLAGGRSVDTLRDRHLSHV